MLLIKALILGIVEAITEFLPISSTGHLIIIGEILSLPVNYATTFDISIQLGAIIALLFLYKSTFRSVLIGPVYKNLLIALIPSTIVGLALHKFIKLYLFNKFTVAIAMIIGGVLIIIVEYNYKNSSSYKKMVDINARRAVIIGIAQSVALFPGISRSGATIIGGMLLGLSRADATKFSFLLAIPTMLLATLYNLFSEVNHLYQGELTIIITGLLSAFISSLAILRFLTLYVCHNSLVLFAYYRIVLGLIILLMNIF